MRTKILVLILTVFCFSAMPVSAETATTKPKKNFVTRTEFKGSDCCRISRIGGWTKSNSRKRVSKKEISASDDLKESENKIN